MSAAWLPRGVPEAARMAAVLLFVGGASVAAENALMPAHVFPAGDRWLAYLSALVFIGLSVAMAKIPERLPAVSWPIISLGSVPVIVLLSVGSYDGSAASQIALCLPVLLAAYHFRMSAAISVLVVALAGELTICFDLLSFDEALEDVIGVGVLLIAVTFMLVGARNRIETAFALLREQAEHDPLTGLSNRRVFDLDIVEAIETGRGATMLMLIDVDNFKSVNDTSGHAAGDALLQDLASCLRLVCRPGDRIYRIGGDELAVLLRDCPLEVAMKRAECVRRAVEDMTAGAGHDWRSTVSIGLAGAPLDGDNARDLMHSADEALYEAKHAGRNRVRVAGTNRHRRLGAPAS
jgi:diguanylate cyclase (GGDEF)-like protein